MMRIRWYGIFLIAVFLGNWGLLQIQAEEPTQEAPSQEALDPNQNTDASKAVAPASAQRSSSKGKRIREKEAEGSEAPNRFEADPVIKSKYQIGNQPLEVDPD